MKGGSHKCYVAVAVSRKNPNDIFGMYYYGHGIYIWDKSKVHVEGWDGNTVENPEVFHEHLGDRILKDEDEIRKERTAKSQMATRLKGTRSFRRSQMSDLYSKTYHACGRTWNEYRWHLMNHYAKLFGKEMEDKFDIRVYRLGSRQCPIKVSDAELWKHRKDNNVPFTH